MFRPTSNPNHFTVEFESGLWLVESVKSLNNIPTWTLLLKMEKNMSFHLVGQDYGEGLYQILVEKQQRLHVAPDRLKLAMVKAPEADIMVKEPVEDIMVKEPVEDIMVKEPEADIMVKEPEADIMVKEPEADIMVKEPEADIMVKEPEADIMVKEPAEDVMVKEPEADIIVKEENLALFESYEIPIKEEDVREMTAETLAHIRKISKRIMEPERRLSKRVRKATIFFSPC